MQINVLRNVMVNGTQYSTGAQDVTAVDAQYMLANGLAIDLRKVSPNPVQQSTVRRVIDCIKAAFFAAVPSNATINAPWLPPFGGQLNNSTVPASAWGAGVAYGTGAAVSNAGNLYICVTAGGGTSGVTAPTGTSLTPVSDGALYWMYYGPVRTATPLPGAPVVSYQASQAALGAGPIATRAYNSPNQFLISGGIPTISGTPGAATGLVGPYVAPALSGNWPTGQYALYGGAICGKLDFCTDAPVFQIGNVLGQLYPSASIAVKIDGAILVPGSLTNGTFMNPGNLQIDFRASGAQPRKERRVQVQSSSGNFWDVVYTDSASTVWAPRRTNPVRWLIEGDSLTAGAFISNTPTYWPAAFMSWSDKFADLIGADDVWNFAVGGTGFISNNLGANTTYLQRLPFLAAQNPDVLMICGNHNDVNYTSAQRVAAIATYLQAVRQLLPNVIILAFGPNPELNSGNVIFQQADADFHNAVLQVGDPQTYWYSIAADSMTQDALSAGVANSWMRGSGSIAAPSGSGNCDIYQSGGLAGPHPSQYGSDYLAVRYAAAVQAIFAPL